MSQIDNKWPLIQGVPRVWPNGSQQCHFCLGLFSTHDKRRCYCSKQCRKAMHNASRRKEQPAQAECGVCHRQFTPRQRNHKWCSVQCKKLAHHRRKHGQHVDRLSHVHTDTEREQRRAELLRDRRNDHDEELERNSLKPYQHHLDILDPDEVLPEKTIGWIAEILADETSNEMDK